VKTDNRQQMLLIIAAVGLALLLGDQFIFQPLSKSWSARSKRIADLDGKLADGRKTLDLAKTLRNKWSNMRTNTLSSDESIAGQQILSAFERWRQDSRINITGYRQTWRHPDDNYATLEFRVDAAGSLQTITRFLYDVEKDPLAVRVEAVELAAHDATGSQFTLGLTVSGLVLQPVEK
jgi:hypothetical protein